MEGDIEARALLYALTSMYTVEQISFFLGRYPTLSEQEVALCLEVSANPSFGTMMRRLLMAGEMCRRVEGENTDASIARAAAVRYG